MQRGTSSAGGPAARSGSGGLRRAPGRAGCCEVGAAEIGAHPYRATIFLHMGAQWPPDHHSEASPLPPAACLCACASVAASYCSQAARRLGLHAENIELTCRNNLGVPRLQCMNNSCQLRTFDVDAALAAGVMNGLADVATEQRDDVSTVRQRIIDAPILLRMGQACPQSPSTAL